jgi:hypothetical protein
MCSLIDVTGENDIKKERKKIWQKNQILEIKFSKQSKLS